MRKISTLFAVIVLSIAMQAMTSVDLGLSVQWATCNVGATKPEAVGSRFAWGETDTKTTYSWSNYTYGKSYNAMTKYCDDSGYGTVDNKTVLDAADDVATKKCGAGWRMPTKAEWEELRTKCTWMWVYNYNSTQVSGYTVMGTNGKSIFLPVTGFGYADKTQQTDGGFYWSSTLHTTPSDAYYVQFSSTGFAMNNNFRYYGQAVRPVEVKHSINLVKVGNGTLESDKTEAFSKDTITLTVVSDKYYALQSITVKQGETVIPTSAVQYMPRQRTFVMPDGDVTVTVEFKKYESKFTRQVFTVNASGKQVYFSQGNLQCSGVTSGNRTWSFAEYQMEMLGNANIASGLADKIDLFGWSGNNETAQWGISTSGANTDYSGAFVDWGNNMIGTNAANTYRTLSSEEWNYLIHTRPNADKLMGIVSISINSIGTEKVNGLVLLPDNWASSVSFETGFAQTTTDVEFDDQDQPIYNTQCSGYGTRNDLTFEQWQQLETLGAVLIPSSFYRYAQSIADTEYDSEEYEASYYWTSTSDGSLAAKALRFMACEATMQSNNRSYGYAVRLVQDFVHNITIASCENGMVTSTISQCAVGDTVALTVVPNKGYGLDEMTVKDANNNTIKVTADYKFAMPASDVTVTATFSEIDYIIAINEYIENGSLTAVSSARYGETVEIEVTADEGYQLGRIFIYDAEGTVPVAEDHSFIMPASDVTITATFAPKTATGLQDVRIENGRVVCDGDFRIYDLLGRDVTRNNGQLEGVYVVKAGAWTQKIVMR